MTLYDIIITSSSSSSSSSSFFDCRMFCWIFGSGNWICFIFFIFLVVSSSHFLTHGHSKMKLTSKNSTTLLPSSARLSFPPFVPLFSPPFHPPPLIHPIASFFTPPPPIHPFHPPHSSPPPPPPHSLISPIPFFPTNPPPHLLPHLLHSSPPTPPPIHPTPFHQPPIHPTAPHQPPHSLISPPHHSPLLPFTHLLHIHPSPSFLSNPPYPPIRLSPNSSWVQYTSNNQPHHPSHALFHKACWT